MGYLEAIMSSMIWGITYVYMPYLFQYFNPLMIILLDGVLRILVIGGIAWWMWLSIFADGVKGGEIESRAWWTLGIMGILGVIGAVLILFAIRNIHPTAAALIEITYPLFIIIFSIFIFHTRPDLSTLIGGLLIFVGVGVIVYTHQSPLS